MDDCEARRRADAGVTWRPVACPVCGVRATERHGGRQAITVVRVDGVVRSHQCRGCRASFKSCEVEQGP